MTRARRWSPGKGWVKIQEWDGTATWMKALPDGALLASYQHSAEHDGKMEKWILELPRGSDFHWTIFDKPRRIRWVLDDHEPGDGIYGTKILLHEICGPSHKLYGGTFPARRYSAWKRRGHMFSYRRVRRGPVLRGWEPDYDYNSRIPRKILAGLEPGAKELQAAAAYRARLWEQWEQEEGALSGAEAVAMLRGLG